MAEESVAVEEIPRKNSRATYMRDYRARTKGTPLSEASRIAKCERERQRYYKNPEYFYAKNRRRYLADKEAYYAYQRTYRSVHPDKPYTWQKKYRLTHPIEVNLNYRKYHAKKKASINDLTKEQWKEIISIYESKCAYCGKKLSPKQITLDHITPISKEGSHTKSNVVPSCKSCNSRKGNRKVLKPVQPVLLTLA